MSESREPTHLPVTDGALAVNGYHISLRFFPELKLERKAGLEFAASLSENISLESTNMEGGRWVFTEPLSGSPDSEFEIAISPGSITLDLNYPPTPLFEKLERRFELVLEKFQESFHPTMLLTKSASVSGIFPIDGDARAFIAGHLTAIDADRMDHLARPIHLVGLRFFMPPFSTKGKKETNWGVDVRAESLMEDPGKLYLEADAQWFEPPTPWSNERTVEETVSCLKTVKSYLETKVIDFLKKETDSGDSLEHEPVDGE
jgi:hypothetical protein